MKKTLIGIVLLLIVVIGAAYLFSNTGNTPATTTNTETPIASATFMCNDGKTIAANFFNGTSTPDTTPGQPPTPTGSVALTLSDGRNVTLPQAISGSGARYANADESMVFWNEGNGAFITENNQQTFMGCIAVAPDPGGFPQIYENGTAGFSVRYPNDYTVNPSYSYTELGP
jgi:membrane-bound inhibitor of C-type lysozyme